MMRTIIVTLSHQSLHHYEGEVSKHSIPGRPLQIVTETSSCGMAVVVFLK